MVSPVCTIAQSTTVQRSAMATTKLLPPQIKGLSAAILLIVAGVIPGGIGFLATYRSHSRGATLPGDGSREAGIA